MATSKPLVSIIMNCYNSDRFLKEAIDTVYDQSYQNWELIFWDNASNDQSSTIARSYDDKVKCFRSEKTTILGEARHQAVKKVKGKYLAFLDCDDLWMKSKLENQVNIFLESDNNLALVYGRSEIISDQKRQNSHFPKYNQTLYQGNIFKYLCEGNFIPFVSAMVDKEKFHECGGFSKDIKHSTDYVLFLKLANKYEVKAMDGVHCKYRMHEGNLTKKLRVTAAEECITALETFLPNQDAKSGIKHHKLNLAIAYLNNKKYLHSLTTVFKYNLFGLLFNRLIRKMS